MWALNYKAECWKTDAFELQCWRRLLRVLWTARISNLSILTEISPEYSLKGLVLKLQYLGHLMRGTNSLEKTLMLEDWRQKKGATEDEMVGWHHWLNGHEFEQAPGDSEGQGSLACCSPRACKESDMTERLNNVPEDFPLSKRSELCWFRVLVIYLSTH